MLESFEINNIKKDIKNKRKRLQKLRRRRDTRLMNIVSNLIKGEISLQSFLIQTGLKYSVYSKLKFYDSYYSLLIDTLKCNNKIYSDFITALFNPENVFKYNEPRIFIVEKEYKRTDENFINIDIHYFLYCLKNTVYKNNKDEFDKYFYIKKRVKQNRILPFLDFLYNDFNLFSITVAAINNNLHKYIYDIIYLDKKNKKEIKLKAVSINPQILRDFSCKNNIFKKNYKKINDLIYNNVEKKFFGKKAQNYKKANITLTADLV